MKNLILFILWVVAVAYSAFIIKGIKGDKHYYNRSCQIIEKYDYVRLTKHKSNYSSRPERSFIIRWDDNKVVEEKEVTVNTFYTFKQGDKVNFRETHESKYEKGLYSILLLISLCYLVISTLILLLNFSWD